MPAPKGNSFWKLRSKHGRDKIFATPEDFWETACEYFQSVTDNPIVAQDNKGTKNVNSVSFIRPFTIHGLCIFMDISRETYIDYRNRDDFVEVVRKVDNIIYNQKFEGAAVGIFNHNIIARDLGLSDKQDIDHTSGGEKLGPLNIIVDDSDTAKTLKKLRDGSKAH
jgi:hypothetical protein